MFRMITVISLFFLLLPGTVQAEGNLDSILEGIQNNYKAMHGLKINYKREVITKTMAMLGDQIKGDLAAGDMYFKPTNFLKLEQKTPKEEFVISNEETLLWYIPDQKTVYKYSAREFGKELRLLCDIFRGLVQVKDRFRVSLLNPNEQGEYQVEMIPATPWQSINRIILSVSKEYKIRIVGIHYQLGAVTIFTLNNVTEKKDFDKDFFNFTVPTGVVLIEEKGTNILP